MAYTRNKGKSIFIQSSSYAHAPAISSSKKEILLSSSLGLRKYRSQYPASTKRQKPFGLQVNGHVIVLSFPGLIYISYVAAGQCYFETVSAGIMKSRRKYRDIILSDNSHLSSLRIFSRYDMQLSAHRYSRLQCVRVTDIRHI